MLRFKSRHRVLLACEKGFQEGFRNLALILIDLDGLLVGSGNICMIPLQFVLQITRNHTWIYSHNGTLVEKSKCCYIYISFSHKLHATHYGNKDKEDTFKHINFLLYDEKLTSRDNGKNIQLLFQGMINDVASFL
ncbi:hypothetical protein QTP88_025668 [Uroleucon formosanum]